MTYDRVLMILRKWFLRACENPIVRKPYSWALYQTWKEINDIEKEN